MTNESEIKPDTIYGDTQAQNAAVFALSYLLGIKLMPRIRNWKEYRIYRSSRSRKYEHIDPLLTSQPIDWKLISDHFSDMVRVALSIKSGKIVPSSILKRFGATGRKNKLNLAFEELGKIIRSIFLLA